MRRQIRARRRERLARLSPQQQQSEAEHLARAVLAQPEVAAARMVTLFADLPGEPGTTPLRQHLARSGVQVLLPIVLPRGQLDWAEDDGTAVSAPPATQIVIDQAAPKGLKVVGGPEPTGPRLGELAPLAADVLIIPALAIDTLGHRLGQGGGYYDRLLARIHRDCLVIALVHDDEVLDAAIQPIPVSGFDQGVAAVATPRRALRLR